MFCAGSLTSNTLNTGNGDNELFPMDQDVTTIADVVFGTVNGLDLASSFNGNNHHHSNNTLMSYIHP